ncbi:hypothetical protein LZ30DRAFT_27139 [Colletotrichum cereale]|nr:hypothetical protein LZ30DRAFT_27139 [Colletotrichum cereale]
MPGSVQHTQNAQTMCRTPAVGYSSRANNLHWMFHTTVRTKPQCTCLRSCSPLSWQLPRPWSSRRYEDYLVGGIGHNMLCFVTASQAPRTRSLWPRRTPMACKATPIASIDLPVHRSCAWPRPCTLNPAIVLSLLASRAPNHAARCLSRACAGPLEKRTRTSITLTPTSC